MKHIFSKVGLSLLALIAFSVHADASLVVVSTDTNRFSDGGYAAAAFDPSFNTGYFASSSSFVSGFSTLSAVGYYTLSNGNVANTTDLAFFDQITNLSAFAFDPATGFGFFASSQAPSALEGISLRSFGGFGGPVLVSSMSFQPSQNWMGTAVVDSANHFAYFGTQTSPSIVVKVHIPDGVTITSMTIVSSMTLPAVMNNLSASVIDATGGFAYFASSTSPGAVAKIRLSDFSLVGQPLQFNAGENGVGSAVIDVAHQMAYFGTHDGPGKVVAVNLTSMARTGGVTMQSGENDLTSAVIDATAKVAYFGTNTRPGHVLKVSLINLFENTGLTLSLGMDFLRSAVIDAVNDYGYFGTYTTPGVVIGIDLLAGPPQIDVQPTESTVHAGDTAIFTLVAEGRSLSYQWQINGVAVPGATAAVFTHQATVADDQAIVSCVVSNANGSVSSAGALLTILPVIRVYPNPWRADRHSGVSVTFDGLIPNSTVKIFNLAAHWVKTLPLASGSALWDLTNDQGEKVASGYYFYLVKTSNDKQTVRGKLAVIR